MRKILKYSLADMLRGRWAFIFFAFYFLVSLSLIYFTGNPAKVILSLMNIVLFLNPLIATVFGVMYYYNNRDFTELLLALPQRRSRIFIGQYFGLSISLSISYGIGVALPFLIFGLFDPSLFFDFIPLLFTGIALLFIFSAIAGWVVMKQNDKLKGFGLAILIWLMLALVYDGLLLFLLVRFNDYPTDKLALWLTIANPIDLSRVLLMLQLDYAALMGYSGAVFKAYLGTSTGIIISVIALFVWVIVPLLFYVKKAVSRDF